MKIAGNFAKKLFFFFAQLQACWKARSQSFASIETADEWNREGKNNKGGE